MDVHGKTFFSRHALNVTHFKGGAVRQLWSCWCQLYVNLDMRRSGRWFPESVSLVDKDERLSGEGSGALSRVHIYPYLIYPSISHIPISIYNPYIYIYTYYIHIFIYIYITSPMKNGDSKTIQVSQAHSLEDHPIVSAWLTLVLWIRGMGFMVVWYSIVYGINSNSYWGL